MSTRILKNTCHMVFPRFFLQVKDPFISSFKTSWSGTIASIPKNVFWFSIFISHPLHNNTWEENFSLARCNHQVSIISFSYSIIRVFFFSSSWTFHCSLSTASRISCIPHSQVSPLEFFFDFA